MVLKLSIVIPAYNEADRIGANLRQVVNYVRENGIDSEIIVVSDASTDNTAKIVSEVIKEEASFAIKLIEHEVNRGKGAAVRKGMEAATGQVHMFMDADLATPLCEISNLLPQVGEDDVVIASRSIATSSLEKPQPPHRRLMGWVFRQLVGLAGVKGIRDSQCGFKLFSAKASQKIFPLQQEDGFAFDVELLALASRFGFTIKEIGVSWHNTERSSVNPLLHPFLMFLTLLRIRWRCTFGDLR